MKGRQLKRVWGEPWDYSYLLKIEQRKLREMANYFKKSKLTEGWEYQVRDCELCVRLLDIVQEKDQPFKSWLNTNYNLHQRQGGLKPRQRFHCPVNLHNAYRFLPKATLNVENPDLLDMWKIELRKIKAFHLYNKIRTYRMMTWWD